MNKLLIFVIALINISFGSTELMAQEKYNRSDYMSRWDVGQEIDCVDTRHYVLMQQSYSEVTWNENGCRVTAGNWYDPFSGTWIIDPAILDIDHIVPLSEAHRSGASEWSKQKKKDFSNYIENPFNLVAVHRSLNRQKGDKDPFNWLPPNVAFWPHYIFMWVTIKEEWELEMDPEEERIIEVLTMYMEFRGDYPPPIPTELILR